jgi:hypothetical protein
VRAHRGAVAAWLAVPGLVLAGPVVAVLATHPDLARPTVTVRESTVSLHLDVPPPGVDVHVSPTTQELLTAAGVTAGSAVGGTSSAASSGGGPVHVRDGVPPGTPTTSSLTQHVLPSCSGTGTDGNRVQVAYVTQVGATDRYASVLPALESYVADVDDVMAVSSAETGGGRRVRWVDDASCVPVIKHVVLPAGSLGSASDSDGGFTKTINAMKAAGYNAANRKYLMFVESDNLCGIAQVYPTSTKVGNLNDGGLPMYARVDSACWTSTYHSVAAHELMHTLGAVQGDVPHPSAAGHCTDDADVMCYVDGPGVVVQNICPAWHEQLYDCNHDDYFSTDPPPGNYLATHWNTADSSFLDVVPALGASATLTVTAPATLRPGLSTTVTVAGAQPAGATYEWTANPSSCLVAGKTALTATVMCPADVVKSVTLEVYRTSAGAVEFGTATVDPATAGPDALTLGLSSTGTSVYAGTLVTLSGALSWAGHPVRGTVTFYAAPTTGTAWTRLYGPVLTDVAGGYHVSVRAWTPQRYKVAVTLPTGSTWTATQPTVTVTAAKRWVGLTAIAQPGRPDIVRARLFTTGTGVVGAAVHLFVRYGTSGAWTPLASRLTGTDGWTYVGTQPGRRAYLYWTYAGSASYVATHSVVVTVAS